MPADVPRPVPGPVEAPFWEWCARHELRLPRCADCATFRFPPRPRCHVCRSAAYTWEPVAGTGTVASYTVISPPVLPAFADRVPYNAVVVELDEGPFLVSNLLDVANEDLATGMRVEVTFVDVADGFALHQFRPVVTTEAAT
ncbi:MAG: hypothetical protein FJW95_04245 [Actinobacteria bacterium]|nr:hypothetical protein [Actinomycetota bacterium]